MGKGGHKLLLPQDGVLHLVHLIPYGGSHGVKAAAERAHLVPTFRGGGQGVVPRRHRPAGLFQLFQRADHPAHRQSHRRARQGQRRQLQPEQLPEFVFPGLEHTRHVVGTHQPVFFASHLHLACHHHIAALACLLQQQRLFSGLNSPECLLLPQHCGQTGIQRFLALIYREAAFLLPHIPAQAFAVIHHGLSAQHSVTDLNQQPVLQRIGIPPVSQGVPGTGLVEVPFKIRFDQPAAARRQQNAQQQEDGQNQFRREFHGVSSNR